MDQGPLINIGKLRDILLLESEFNALDKIIFNTRVLHQLESDKIILQDIIGDRTSQSEIQLVVRKKLITGTANQKKTLILVSSTDATNCCDRVVHTFAYLTPHHFGLNL